MENNLSKKFERLPEIELPVDLHGRIMSEVVSFRVKKGFITIFSLLLLNLSVAGYFMVIRLIHNDTFALINFMIREFELSESYFIQLLFVLYKNIPVGLLTTVVLNIILIGYILKMNFSFKNKNVGRAF